eukprot:515361-Pelagomonas_calceolata.AAC.3
MRTELARANAGGLLPGRNISNIQLSLLTRSHSCTPGPPNLSQDMPRKYAEQVLILRLGPNTLLAWLPSSHHLCLANGAQAWPKTYLRTKIWAKFGPEQKYHTGHPQALCSLRLQRGINSPFSHIAWLT